MMSRSFTIYLGVSSLALSFLPYISDGKDICSVVNAMDRLRTHASENILVCVPLQPSQDSVININQKCSRFMYKIASEMSRV